MTPIKPTGACALRGIRRAPGWSSRRAGMGRAGPGGLGLRAAPAWTLEPAPTRPRRPCAGARRVSRGSRLRPHESFKRSTLATGSLPTRDAEPAAKALGWWSSPSRRFPVGAPRVPRAPARWRASPTVPGRARLHLAHLRRGLQPWLRTGEKAEALQRTCLR